MKKKKTTKMFKETMLINRILPFFQWKGSRMCFPYTWNGEQKFAVIKLVDLMKIIKWDQK